MLPLQHLKRKNLEVSQPPTETINSENQRPFRQRLYSLTDEVYKFEVEKILAYQKNMLGTKLRLTLFENHQIMKRRSYSDPMIEALMQKQFGAQIKTLRDEMVSVLMNHFRVELYDHLVRVHCTNVFQARASSQSQLHNANAPVQGLYISYSLSVGKFLL